MLEETIPAPFESAPTAKQKDVLTHVTVSNPATPGAAPPGFVIDGAPMVVEIEVGIEVEVVVGLDEVVEPGSVVGEAAVVGMTEAFPRDAFRGVPPRIAAAPYATPPTVSRTAELIAKAMSDRRRKMCCLVSLVSIRLR